MVCGAFVSLDQDCTSFSKNEASTTSCPSLSLSDHVCADSSLLDEVTSGSPMIIGLIVNFLCVIFFEEVVLRFTSLKLDYFMGPSTTRMTPCPISSLPTFENPCGRPFFFQLVVGVQRVCCLRSEPRCALAKCLALPLEMIKCHTY